MTGCSRPIKHPGSESSSSLKGAKMTSSHNSLPVAKPLYFDFQSHGEYICWEVTECGWIVALPMATEVALIEPPTWFPSIPGIIDSQNTELREAVEGLYEVANILESLQPSLSVQKAYVKCVRKMETAFSEASSIGDCKDAMVQICENATFELEALVGAIQIFGGKQLTDTPGAPRVGALMTIPWYPFERNYNLNFVMTRWMRLNWSFPYPSHADMYHLTQMYNFEPDVVLSWLDNAINMVWRPLTSTEWMERFDLLDPNTNVEDVDDTTTNVSTILPSINLPLGHLVKT